MKKGLFAHAASEEGYCCFGAFTLAEVLITLGVIGVVAALTIPTLLASYKDMVFENQRKAATSRISQALGMIYAKEQLGEITDTEAMKNELTKQLKVLKVCSKGDISACFVDEIITETPLVLLGDMFMPPAYALSSGYKINRAENDAADKLSINSLDLNLLSDGSSVPNSEFAGLVLADGTNMLFMYNPDCNYSGVNNSLPQANQSNQNLLNSIFGINSAYAVAGNATVVKTSSESSTVLPTSADQRACFGAIVDINGIKKPNTVGKDVFLYQASLSKLSLIRDTDMAEEGMP